MKYLTLSIPGPDGSSMPITSDLPQGVPTGGLTMGINIIFVFIDLILVFAALFALWQIYKGGVDMITSGGHKEKLKNGRERVLYAVLGLAITFLSFFITGVVSAFIGVDILPFGFKP